MSKEFEQTYNTTLSYLVSILKTDIYSNFSGNISNIKYAEWKGTKREVQYTVIFPLKTSNVTETQEIIRVSVDHYILKCVQIYERFPFNNTLFINIIKNGDTTTKIKIKYILNWTTKCIQTPWKMLINSNIDNVYENFNSIISLFIG